MNEPNIFNELGTPLAETGASAANVDAGKKARKEKFEVMRAALKETISEDPTFQAKLRSLSKDIMVVECLGFGDKGNIVVDKKAANRTIVNTARIVGYRVKNTGKTPMKYLTEKWTLGADGKYVSQKIEKTLTPGGTADLNRQHMTMFCTQPEISFTLQNGRMTRGSAQSKGILDAKAEFEAYYFAFTKDEKGNAMEVNSDEVKMNIGVKDAAGKWTVKPEFVETFGYLNNPKESNAKRAKTPDGITVQDIAANWMRKLAEESASI